MLVELVETETEDRLTLYGALHRPAGAPDPRWPVDAIILLHGVGSNFYSSPVLAYLAEQFTRRGMLTLRANTRGHDFVSLARTASGPQRQGAAYENVGHCHYDIAAWIKLLKAAGAERVGLVGHSLGAVKAIYASAWHPSPATRIVVAMSPPRLSYAEFQRGPRKTLFARHMARAQAHLDEGKPESLLRVKYPFPLLITAAGYLEKYGPAEKYNLLRFVERLGCSTFFTFGQEELESGSVAFAGLPSELENLSTASGPLQTCTIAGANHLYDGCYTPLANALMQWLDGLVSAEQ